MTSMTGGAFPSSWPERIRALDQGELTPVTPRRAATVLLLRDGPDGAPDGARGKQDKQGKQEKQGPAVHLLRRRASMAFAAGAYAYPGGGVDPRDERPVEWAGPALDVWSAALGVPPAIAQAVVCAAVRETFEESGVLLAGPREGSGGTTVVADTTGADWEADRTALVRHELAFADFLARRDLVLRSDLLAPWARWITPEFEERRYDTWFFLALLPAGQRTRDVSGEADRTAWLRPAEAVAGYDRGEMVMLPPTITTLRALLPYASAADALAAAPSRDLTPVLARAVLDESGTVVLTWPGHDEFTRVLPPANPANPPNRPNPPAPPQPQSPPQPAAPCPDVQSPDVQSPDVQGPDVQTPAVQGPDVHPPDVQNQSPAAPTKAPAAPGEDVR